MSQPQVTTTQRPGPLKPEASASEVGGSIDIVRSDDGTDESPSIDLRMTQEDKGRSPGEEEAAKADGPASILDLGLGASIVGEGIDLAEYQELRDAALLRWQARRTTDTDNQPEMSSALGAISVEQSGRSG